MGPFGGRVTGRFRAAYRVLSNAWENHQVQFHPESGWMAKKGRKLAFIDVFKGKLEGPARVGLAIPIQFQDV
jgi:hypothetical protein